MKKYILGALVLCLMLSLCACNETPAETTAGTTEPLSTEVEYQVTVADALGTPYTSGIIVRFMQNGSQSAMAVVNEQGVASQTLPRDNYTVELAFTGDETGYYYDNTGLELTAEKTQLQVTLAYAQGTEGQSLFALGNDYDAYRVGLGCTHVKLVEGRNFFLFTPEQAGMYAISVPEGTAVVGYYGAPHFVQEFSAVEPVDNVVSVSVKASMIGTSGTGTTTLVIGLDAEAAGECTLAVERTGEPAWDISDEPWSTYQTTAQLSAFTLPADAQLVDFDMTASTDTYTLVYNESDGFYHLDTADGPLVLIRLTKKSSYLDPLDIVAEKSHVCKYFYDESGAFVKKESYNECLENYFLYVDEATGTYPLTEDLKYIIQQRGDYYGWWKQGSSGFIFADEAGNALVGLNTEIAWLFACCYIAE